MKLIARKKQLQTAPEIWLRSAGYAYIPEKDNGERSFARRLSRDFYPRFHIYFVEKKNTQGEEFIVFNLHLDQKRPGYAGQKRHNAEYEGEVVESEARRLQALLLPEFMAQ